MGCKCGCKWVQDEKNGSPGCKMKSMWCMILFRCKTLVDKDVQGFSRLEMVQEKLILHPLKKP